MAVEVNHIPLKRIVSFPFQDAESRSRSLIAAALTLAGMIVPIVPGIFVSGYMIRMMRKAIREGDVSMPAWDDWNTLLVDGLKCLLISICYIGPGMLLLFAGMAIYFISFAVIMPLMDTNPESSLLLFIPMAVMFLSLAVGMILLLVGALPLPVAIARFADTGELKTAFQWGEMWKNFKANWLGYVTAWIVGTGLLQIFGMIYGIAYATVVCCIFGILLYMVGTTWAGFTLYAMIGLAYREGKAG